MFVDGKKIKWSRVTCTRAQIYRFARFASFHGSEQMHLTQWLPRELGEWKEDQTSRC